MLGRQQLVRSGVVWWGGEVVTAAFVALRRHAVARLVDGNDAVVFLGDVTR
jgi:pyruvate/2-oxoglutarate dehydrogenase complex dihydrolipoamide acyltransferase (E2) component